MGWWLTISESMRTHARQGKESSTMVVPMVPVCYSAVHDLRVLRSFFWA